MRSCRTRGGTSAHENLLTREAHPDLSPDLWRRYARIALQGLRPEGTPLEPLPIAAVEPERMEQLLIGAWKRR